MNKNLIIIICSILLVILLGALFFEIREVPDVKWEPSKGFDDKEPRGLYVFRQMVERYYDGVPSETISRIDSMDTDRGLYIAYHDRYHPAEVIDTLISHAARGHDILLLTDDLHYRMYEENDSYDTQYISLDSVRLQPMISHGAGPDSGYIYRRVDSEFAPQSSVVYQLLRDQEYYGSTKAQVIIKHDDSLAVMIKIPIDKGAIHIHIMPEVFYNVSYQQEGIFDFTTDVLSTFDPQSIHFIKSKKNSSLPQAEHPLQYIMSSPPLKAAYLLLFLGVLLFMFFEGRRRQKVIPIIEKNKNTSLEYIDTLSQLYHQQGQHAKLIAHMRDIFYHKMEGKYFIKKNHPQYLDILVKKSKLPREDLEYIMNRFQNLQDNFSFSAHQLIQLNRKLEAVYLHMERSGKKRHKSKSIITNQKNTE